VRRNVMLGAATAVLAVASLPWGNGQLTRQTFIQEADAICAATMRAFNAIPRPTGPPVNYVGPIAQLKTLIEGAVQQLATLNGPSGGKLALDTNLLEPERTAVAQADAFVAAMQSAGSSGSAVARQHAAYDHLAAALSDRLQVAHDNSLAAYGFKDCSQTN
jgi:hypothetical protein